MLGIKYEILFFFSEENAKALNTMSITADNTKDCRFLFGANPECLVLKKELSFTFTGDGKEDENFGNKSSKSHLFRFAVFSF